MSSKKVARSASAAWLALVAGLACADTGVFSSTVTNLSNTEIVSTDPGATVNASQTRTVESTFFNGVTTQTYSLSATSIGQARSDFGVNGVFVSGQRNTGLVPQIGSPFYIASTSEAGAFSQWRDDWQVFGGPVGTFVDVQFDGTVTGAFAGPADDLARTFFNGEPIAFEASYTFTNGGSGQNSITLTASDFIAAASPSGTFSLSWSIVTSMPVGYVGQIDSRFAANTYAQNMSCPAECSETITFASMTTSRIDRIVVPTGFSLQVGSGQLSSSPIGYVYAATLVPEPAPYLLFLLGLAGLTTHVARRKAPMDQPTKQAARPS